MPEASDVRPRTAALWGFGMLAAAALVAGGVYLLLQLLQGMTLRPPVSAVESSAPPPPEPRLQVSPRDDLTRTLALARARLDSGGWVDRQRGIAHIPIDRAMRMEAERGWQP